MSSPLPARPSGFTLAEVMIALFITALIGTLVWSSFSSTFATKEQIEAEADIYRELRVGMARMTREISMAFISNNYDTRRFKDNTDRPTFFTGDRDTLSFTMFGHQRLARDAKESDQSVVFYKVGRDPEVRGETALLRCEKPVFDDDMDRCDDWLPMIGGVKRIEFQYWDNKKNDWTREWDTRRSDYPNQLPDQVRIELTLVDDQKKERVFTTQARVNLVSILELK